MQFVANERLVRTLSNLALSFLEGRKEILALVAYSSSATSLPLSTKFYSEKNVVEEERRAGL